MKCITIQNKMVLDILQNKGYFVKPTLSSEYISDIEKSYLFMKEVYHYENMPIFLAPIDYKVEFYGANFDENSIALELDIPDKYLKIQNYYDWSDFIYFIGEEDVFKNVTDKYTDVFDYGKDILLSIKNRKYMNLKDTFQLTTDILKKEWILSQTTDTSKIKEKHDGSGGQYILSELKEYVRKDGNLK